MHKLEKEFLKYIYELQDNEDTPMERLIEIGKIIKEKKLLDKCEDRYFAKQLCSKNNIPKEYWSDSI